MNRFTKITGSRQFDAIFCRVIVYGGWNCFATIVVTVIAVVVVVISRVGSQLPWQPLSTVANLSGVLLDGGKDAK